MEQSLQVTVTITPKAITAIYVEDVELNLDKITLEILSGITKVFGFLAGEAVRQLTEKMVLDNHFEI